MVHTGVVGSSHSSRRAAAVSLVLHGAAVWLLVTLGKSPVPPRPTVALTTVEVVNASRPASPSAPVSPPPGRTAPLGRPIGTRAGAGVHGRREPVQRAQPAEPRAVQSLADLQVHYEGATHFADHGAARPADVTSGVGASGIGAAQGSPLGDGALGVTIPDAPGSVSRARGPRPKHDYSNMRIVGASRFAGRTITVRLSIDARGRVHAVQLLQGVDREIDRKTVALVRDFEYEPALDDDGSPIPGTQRWEFQIVEEDGF
ncbi:MAG TPA: TonB family protein [Kofleriaceae bacterium]|jgi:TonB family protein|nr:TonB family protein [Kofleriaceae bacterium]